MGDKSKFYKKRWRPKKAAKKNDIDDSDNLSENEPRECFASYSIIASRTSYFYLFKINLYLLFIHFIYAKKRKK